LYGVTRAYPHRQELRVGVGLSRVAEPWALRPGVLHLNEGTAASPCSKAIRTRMRKKALASTRRLLVSRARCVHDHTPVPAGHDRFDCELIEEHLGPLREQLGISAIH